MRRLFSGLALGAIALTSFLATAQTFPNPPTSATPFWIPMTRGGVPVADAVSAQADARDIVGDARHPAAFLASDASYLYLRVRVNGNPGTADDLGFGCLIDTDGTLTTYEYLASYDLNGADTIRYLKNTATTTSDTAAENAETAVTTFSTATNGRIGITGDNIFSSNADYFVDLAIPWTTIRTGGITSATALRFICGTTTDTSTADDLGNDIFDGNAAASLSTSWSDAYTCNNGSNPRCVTATDNDGDGVQNGVETGFGTNPNNFDSDGDGLPDFYELLSSTSDITFAAIKSDSDSKIDALDTDSDNDCTADSAEGLTSYRTANAQPNLACSGTTPICDRSSGVCAACNGDFGSGHTLPCSAGPTPYCDSAGRCSQCTATQRAACNTTAKPSCDTSTGFCSACNGDFNSGKSAVCPLASQPACNAGKCTQCSATNVALCTSATPACGAVTGTCVQCTGDHGDAASDAPCPNATSPACNASGPLKGRCSLCSASNVAKCPTDKPTCDTNNGTCTACDGDHNGGTFLGCPSDAAPTCVLGGATKGQCHKCTTSADCGLGHTGPTCNPSTGACIDADTDGDGIQDEVEDILGTDKTKKDTDGDGIDDGIEVTPQGGGSYAKVDSDSDTIIDALDLDSDSDGIPDGDEWNASGPVLDTDGDKIPNYRDRDDDADGIATADEIADATMAGVSDDVDNDGAKNWLDKDANGNTIIDGTDGRTDEDEDGIPNYLDLEKNPPKPDAGASSSSSSSSSSSTSSTSGFTNHPAPDPEADAGRPPPPPPPDDAVLEGSGCSTSSGSLPSVLALFLAVLGLGLVTRRRR